ncbi:MAG: hypothetical protein EHM19_06085, partial [Candidatus Latescibacterota bacterium]
ARLRLAGLEGEARREEEKRVAFLALRCGKAARAFEILAPIETTDPDAALASGLAALRAGRSAEAAELLRTADRLGTADRELVRFRLAEAEKGLPEKDRGLPLFLEIASEPKGRYRTDALEEALLDLFSRRRNEEALALARREHGADLEGLEHRGVLYLAAEAERLGGNNAVSARLHRRLLEEWPEHGRALDSYRQLRKMEASGAIAADERLAFLGARAAARAGREDEAIQFLRPLLDRPADDPLRAEAEVEKGKILYGAERYRAALEVFERLGARSDETGATALLYRARTLRKMGEYLASIEAYGEYARRFPASELAPEAQWEIAWRWKLLRRPEEAILAFREVPLRFPESEYAPRAALQEALCLDELGRTGEARAAIESALGRLGGADRVEALYWLADASIRLGDSTRARGAYLELADEHPETYYGLRAAGRLGRTVIRPPEIAPPGAEGGDPLVSWIRSWSVVGGGAEPDLGPLSLLVSLAEWREARRQAAALRRTHDDDPAALARIARFCRRSALYDETIRCGRRIQALAEEAGADDVRPELLALIYPLGYLDVVVREAARYPEIDPLFVVALMRQESWFHPSALSSAGARGLMQLLPSTAKHVAGRLGEAEGFRPERLDDPVRNIRYGLRYLSSLLDRYSGDALVAASAYNAGEGNADVWLAGGGEGGDRFIEKITFSETRTYVKRVLSGYWICRSLYGDYRAAEPMG